MSEGPGGGDWRLGINPRPCPDCPPRGEQGEHGDQGERGATGAAGSIPPRIRGAFAFLFVLMFALAAVNLLWSWHLATGQNTDECALIQKIAAISVPQPAAGNPSREFAARVEAAFRARGRQLGCGA